MVDSYFFANVVSPLHVASCCYYIEACCKHIDYIFREIDNKIDSGDESSYQIKERLCKTIEFHIKILE